MPAFPLKNLQFVQGSSFYLPQSTPHPVYVLEAWATWCPPCRQTIPHLNTLSKQFSKRGVVFVGITSEDNEAKIKQFISSMGDQMTYPVALDKSHEMDAYARHFKAEGIPHAYLVDCMGVIRWHGHPAEPSLAGKLDVLANERANKVAAEESTVIPSNQLTSAMLSSLSVGDIKWALKANHLNSADYLEKSDMLLALLELNKVQPTKLKGKSAGPSVSAEQKATTDDTGPAKSATPLSELTSDQVSKMSVSELKRLIKENHIAVNVGEGLEKSDLVNAVIAALGKDID